MKNMYNLVNIKKENQNGGDLKEKVKNMIGAKQMKYIEVGKVYWIRFTDFKMYR